MTAAIPDSRIRAEAARLRREFCYSPQEAQAMAELMALIPGFYCADDVPQAQRKETP